MASPLRIEFPNALYHVTARGNRQEAIYLDDEDRCAFQAPWAELKQQIYLGSNAFVEAMQEKADMDADLTEIPAAQKRKTPKPLSYYQARYHDRDTAILKAYESGGYSQAELGRHFELHYSRISRIVKQAERENKGVRAL
jgi:hypothetical protein